MQIDKLLYFLAGSAFTMILMLSGAFMLVEATPERKAEWGPEIKQHMAIFKILAPKGMEDYGYIQMQCTPSIHKSKLLSGKK